MIKAELIAKIAKKQAHIYDKDVSTAVAILLEHITDALAHGDRIEVRGFGSFSLHHRVSRIGRNPKSGELVSLPAKYVPYFKPGKELRQRVNCNYQKKDERH